MYICEDCKGEFEEPEQIRICNEIEYGVSDLFPRGTWTEDYMNICPFCRNVNIKEIEVEEDED